MNIALVGFGVENQSAYRYWAARMADITVCDKNLDITLPDGVTGQLGDAYLDNLGRFDVVVRTVGMHPRVILDRNPGIESKITTAVNLFFEECRTPIIGVTGTKGKGTTSTLIHQILLASGKKSLLAGNIGTPMLDVLEEAAEQDYIVLELSSFQLYDLKQSPARAVCLMVVPEHLNWHQDMDDYKRAKSNIFRYQNSDDVAIYNALSDDSRDIASASPAVSKLTYAVPPAGETTSSLYTVRVQGESIYFHDQEILKTAEVKLLGRHNLENVCAAIAATWDLIDGNTNAIRQVVSTFTGLEYRLELVKELNGVKYYNDSFSTTPETAIAALQSFSEPKIIILGGSDKGIPFDGLAEIAARSNVRHALCIGQTGPVIAELLRNRGVQSVIQDGLDSMQAIVSRARELAQPGDVVLLSTGCASFGMFRDYKDRGSQFKQAVQALV